MTGPHIHLTHHRHDVAVVRIDRPPVNALPPADWRALGAALADLAADGEIRAVVISGTTRAFCAGADVRVLTQPDESEAGATMLETVAEACAAVERVRVPVLAAIEGPAHGGGLELALSCDIRIASTDATFAASSVNMGLIASVATLVQTVGAPRARRMLLSGQRIGAETAHEWGLITDLVDGDAMRTAIELAEHIAAKPPLAVEAIKRAVNAAPRATAAELDQLVTELFAVLARTADNREALDALLEKRAGSDERR